MVGHAFFPTRPYRHTALREDLTLLEKKTGCKQTRRKKHYNLQHCSEIPERSLSNFTSSRNVAANLEMLYIRMSKPTLKVQTDSIRAKVFI